jgi:DNA-directed RNA polymerase subunit RPC12/RpoP
MIKSRPVYEALRIDPAGRAHLVVTDLPALPGGLGGLEFGDVETWVVKLAAPGIPAPGGPARAFRAVADLLATLAVRLAREAAGLRLYAVGTEAFLWDAHRVAAQAGLGQGEVYLSHAGSLKRRVYCSHCKTMNEDVTTSLVKCRACGANLFVRDHFSRRLAAFMGVAVDAEVPGEIPPVEVLYE